MIKTDMNIGDDGIWIQGIDKDGDLDMLHLKELDIIKLKSLIEVFFKKKKSSNWKMNL